MAAVRWVCVVVLFLFVFQWQCNADQFVNENKDKPLITSQFTRYRTFRPLVYHGREKRHIQNSFDLNGHVSDLSIAYALNNKTYILDLRLQRNLLTDNYFEKYHLNGEQVVLQSEATEKQKTLCQYQGKIRDLPESWAALSTCAGLSGVIFDGAELHYVEPKNGSSFADEHVLLSHSDLSVNFTCGTRSGQPHSSHIHHRARRQSENALPSAVRGPFKANSRSRYVELVLVVDNKSYESQDKDLKRVFRRCKDIANIVNALYVPLNIFVALVGIVVWTEKDEIQISVKGDETLTNFLHYRRVRLSKEHPNDNAQLLTGVQFQGGVVGKALKGPMCTYEFSGGVAMDHSPAVGLVATTVAHEMGHNFGMEHDNDSLCECPDDRCIMAASSSTISPTRWSSCSLENLALAFEHGMDYCLRNKPVSLFESPECGNMFLEEGEECDCGLPGNCDNPCCNPHTCKLHTNATCATGDCCDTSTCRLKTAGTPCRSALVECDLPEYCTGTSEFCPNNLYKMDGTSCGKGKAYCYEGSCRSHSDQCRLLWGPSGQGSDAQCYKQNTHGNKTGNCGYLKFNETYLKCATEDVQCGLLHCSHLNERLEFGMESVAVLSHSFFNVEGKIVPCRTANIDLGLQDVDPGLVPNGAKCGDNRLCLNQSCVPVSSVIKAGCPHKCSYNGECNNLGKCHCKAGYAPPHCDYPGAGGSEDGGPASDPNVKSTFVVVMFVIFLGIVPCCALLFCCWYCYSDRQGRKWLWETVRGSKKQMSALPTRGSPDFTQPPNSSHSSASNLPSRRVHTNGNITFWPFSLWIKKPSGKPIPTEDTSRRIPPTRLDISAPMPLSSNGTRYPTAAGTTSSHPTSTSFVQNLAGNFKGFTLSPLNEQADSSFDSFDSMESVQGPAPLHKTSQNSVHSQAKATTLPVKTGIVAARANFYAGVPTSKETPLPAKSNSLPHRPAPAVPTPNVVKPLPAIPSEMQKKSTIPTTHTEITITKTVQPVSKTEGSNKVVDNVPKKPVESFDVASIKAKLNKSDQSSPQPTEGEPTFSSTLQRVTSIFKPNSSGLEANNGTTLSQAPPSLNGSGANPFNRNQSIKAAKINRESLRGIEISLPIPQNEIELSTQSKVVPVRRAPPPPLQEAPDSSKPSDVESPVKTGMSNTLPRPPKTSKVHFADDDGGRVDPKDDSEPSKPVAVVEKSESVRVKGVTQRPNIPHFGSMRGKRPLSMPFARPTSPPPNPPASALIRASAIVENDYPYDDCSLVKGDETDAIYASIEELPLRDISLKRDETGSTTTSNSDGLLSEIVSELKKKNLDTASALKTDNLKTQDTHYSVVKEAQSNTVVSATSKSLPLGTSEPSKKITRPTPQKVTTTSTSTSLNNPTDKNLSLNQSFKPYSSSLAARNRYLGNSGNATNAGSTNDSGAPVSEAAASNNKRAKSPIAESSASEKHDADKSVCLSDSNQKNIFNAIPLPQQPPVGKLSTSPTNKISSVSDKSSHITSSNSGTTPAAGLYAIPSKSGIDAKKKNAPEAADAGSSAKPKAVGAQGTSAGTTGSGIKDTTSIKGKTAAPVTSKTSSKPTGVAARPAVTTSVTTTTAKSTNRPTPASTSINSSLGKPNVSANAKANSSLVQSMQKKFDAPSSNPKKGSGTGTAESTRPTTASKAKTSTRQ